MIKPYSKNHHRDGILLTSRSLTDLTFLCGKDEMFVSSTCRDLTGGRHGILFLILSSSRFSVIALGLYTVLGMACPYFKGVRETLEPLP